VRGCGRRVGLGRVGAGHHGPSGGRGSRRKPWLLCVAFFYRHEGDSEED